MIASLVSDFEITSSSSSLCTDSITAIDHVFGHLADEELAKERFHFIRNAHNSFNIWRNLNGETSLKGKEFLSKNNVWYKIPDFKKGILKEHYIEYHGSSFHLKPKTTKADDSKF